MSITATEVFTDFVTPFTGNDGNGMIGESNQTIESTGQTLNPVDRTQTTKAMAVVAARGNVYLDAGAVNVYTAAVLDAQLPIFEYQNGMEFRVLITSATNTGASTMNVGGLGAVNIFYNGVAVIAGMIPINTIIRLRHDGTQFNLVQDIDNDAFYIDKINKRIGVNKTNPQEAVDVDGNGLFSGSVDSLNAVKARIVFDTPGLNIKSSFNVSGVVDLLSGNYRIDFIAPLPGIDHSISIATPTNGGGTFFEDMKGGILTGTLLTTSVTVSMAGWSNGGSFGGNTSATDISVIVS